MVDARDLKSRGPRGPCRFESGPGYHRAGMDDAAPVAQDEQDERDVHFMRQAIALARRALASGDTPVGSLVVRAGSVLAEGVEAVRAGLDITAHAEIIAVREACRAAGGFDLSACTLYTTAEPCWMC